MTRSLLPVALLLIVGACTDRTVSPADPALSSLIADSAAWPGAHRMTIAGPEEPGERMTLIFTFTDSTGTRPAIGATINAFHTTAAGVYEETNPGDESTSRLRGTAVTDSAGRIAIESILPGNSQGSDDGRHIHTAVSGAKPEYYDVFFAQHSTWMGRRWVRGSRQAVLATLHQLGDRVVAAVTLPVRGLDRPTTQQSARRQPRHVARLHDARALRPGVR